MQNYTVQVEVYCAMVEINAHVVAMLTKMEVSVLMVVNMVEIFEIYKLREVEQVTEREV